jgi:hypothetical protein
MKATRVFPLLAGLLLFGCAGSSNDGRTEMGESQVVNGHTATTYAHLNASGNVDEVGVTVPYDLITNPPAPDSEGMQTNHGPAGSFLSIAWPQVVKDQTFFNHYEMHWNPNGHEPEAWMVPHFDLHAYGVSEADVFAVTPPDTAPPAADRLPEGYVYPGVDQCVPQMGVHAVIPGPEALPPSTIVLGYYHGAMTFVEPMVTQEKLMEKQSFSLEIRKPDALDRSTLYPTRFRAIFETKNNRYKFVFDNFEMVSG